jgi:hypothetical protein
MSTATLNPIKTTPENTPGRKILYFKDPFMDLMFLHTLTLHGFKGSEIGECYSAAAQIREGDVQSYIAAWEGLAQQVEGIARDAEAKGHLVTARQAYLRAVSYYRNASMAFRPSEPGFRSIIEKYRSLFSKFSALCDPPIEVVEIPYEGKTLPAYFMRPDATGQKRPTIICGDNVSEELYYWIGPPALERGYNALLVDLPGIGLNPLNGICFRSDTEVPVKAVIDYLCSRGDVDPESIAVYGGGEPGGYIMTRAATGDKRISACIVDPLVSDMGPIVPFVKSHTMHVSPGEETVSSIYSEILPFWGITDDPAQAENLRKMKADTKLITCNMLCLNDAMDYPELQRQVKEAAATMLKPSLHVFTSVDRTNVYRELDNFGLKHRVMFDWLDDVFKMNKEKK